MSLGALVRPLFLFSRVSLSAAGRVSAAASARRFVALKPRHRGTAYVPRRVARRTLGKASKQNAETTLLLPPFVSASELRILFRLDYPGIFKLLGVRFAESKYFWKDYDGRQFETSSKRKVLVPFELASVPAQGLGLRPTMVDVEPDWDTTTDLPIAGSKPSAPVTAAATVPVIAVLGHINHGKTTLLDALCGTAVAASEPGGITQGVRAMTTELTESEYAVRGPFAEVLPYSPACRAQGRVDPRRMTFLDTPGHEVFEVARGRTMATADVALVVVSVEHGAGVQTEEVLMHASRWRVPVVFALNKIDLPNASLDLTRAELRRQCQRLHEQGLVDVDWTREAEEAVPISALQHRNLDGLLAKVCSVVEGLRKLPTRPLRPPSSTPGEAKRLMNVPRRTDFLVGAEGPPAAVALVVEVERGAETGEKVLTLIVRAGRLAVDQFFVVGTAMGKITHLSVASGVDGHQWTACDTATPGVAVRVMGLRNRKLGGDCVPDDVLYALPRERAWRLSEHRRRIEELMSLQADGPPIEVPWEHDSMMTTSRTQAAFERSRHEQPEKHASSAYERRWQQPAVEELSPSDMPETKRPPSVFVASSRRAFDAPLGRAQLGMAARPSGSDSESDLENEPRPETGRGGRRSAARRVAAAAAEADDVAPARKPGEDLSRRFLAVRPAEEEEAEAQSPRAGGRRSSRVTAGSAQRLPTGAWVSNQEPEREFIYYTDRVTFEEDAEINSTRLRSRWRWRDRDRWEEQRRQDQMRRDEMKLAEDVRRGVFGEAAEPEEEPEKEQGGDHTEERESPEPLPGRGRPVVPMILKTRTVGQFDVLMDEVEQLQERHGVRVVIVHGGLGPVIPKDIVHAEVEKQYGFCPIYAFQVGCVPLAADRAHAEKIDIRRFDVFTELLAEVEARCSRIVDKARLARYSESVLRRPDQRSISRGS